ncbi:TPA: DUF4276 family protein [Pseudomonas aeruginosa]|uniref:DUF4276 family protein n=1 Tax=Pseudomonas aeruginosa TaxID=287 RepID=UPI000E677420|nr:DUF4276 family protein [Pseudomonas aeruginosa]MBH4356866.1 DUF4276 family protein [Pseudomonas aeruginosa]RTC35089.1 DUF4276 family protein [Pseudomonas aeruginosa]HEJ1358340.1 DUF4276 family protein [Pseudomonas aeruginosa]HEK2195350.1 DUF4276 family protein [Pseudomonas aeruginosa]HEP8427570.1 DUF4276 family protein [Pseudomonas aeruginosa]
MIRVCIVCEGATEVEFVKSCLVPHLLNHGVNAYPSIVQAPSGRHRGGRVTVERLARFISHEYHAADRLTTLVDYYGFQDAEGRTRNELERDILDCVVRYAAGVDPRFVRPYVQMHEFEGLLFSDVEQFQYVLDGWDADVRQTLINIREQFQTPEDINNSRQTAPSKRILASFPDGSYSKTEHGPVIADAIGLTTIRQQCPQFDGWITMLEEWAK